MSYRGANNVALLQTVLLWSQGLARVDGMHTSHLYDRPGCVLPGHVLLETPKQNNSRKNCGWMTKCREHPGCDKFVLHCRHQPLCIPRRRPEGVVGSWEDFLGSGRLHVVTLEESEIL